MSPAVTSREIRRALDLEAGQEEGRTYPTTSTDSRTVEEGALFVALQGARHDGFDFLEEAADHGARGAIVPRGRERPPVDLEWFPVEDTERALGDLAAWTRRQVDARVVGITGSSGKTTVKEMAAAALAEDRQVYRTAGNLNSQVGLPLAILAAPADVDLWILELGSNAPGEIARLTEISTPDDAVVTTVGPAHLAGLGDEAGVLDEKLDLLRGARSEGVAVVGEVPEILPRAALKIRPDVIVAGLGDAADVRPDAVRLRPDRVEFEHGGTTFRIGAGGEHHLRDALMAVALAEALGASPEDAAAGLAEFRPLGMRGALRQLGTVSVVADCYNANPESFDAAIDYCVDAFTGRRMVAAVGSMLELGPRSAEEHRRVARRLLEVGFSTVVATGAFVEAFTGLDRDDVDTNGTRVLTASDPDEAARLVDEELRGDEVVLVKGSRGARLERVVDYLESRYGKGES